MVPHLIRLDFVLAVALLVVVPLGLLVAAMRIPRVRGRILAYWRASSLLMVTVYLMIDGRSVAFVTGNVALVLIPPVLYYGDGLSEPEDLGEGAVAAWVRRWRTAVTGFCAVNLLFTAPTLGCVGGASERPFCEAWWGPPRELHQALHPSLDPAALGNAATAGLLVYGAYLTASAVRGALYMTGEREKTRP